MSRVKVLSGKSENTKIVKYIYDDGTVSEVEVDAVNADLIEVSYREESNYDRKCRYWNRIRLDESEYEGSWFMDDNTPSRLLDLEAQEKEINQFIDTLTDVEKKRLQIRLDDPSVSYREISRMEGVSSTSIIKCFNRIQKKFETFLKKSKNLTK